MLSAYETSNQQVLETSSYMLSLFMIMDLDTGTCIFVKYKNVATTSNTGLWQKSNISDNGIRITNSFSK